MLGAWMFVFVLYVVFSYVFRSLCDKLITLPKEVCHVSNKIRPLTIIMLLDLRSKA